MKSVQIWLHDLKDFKVREIEEKIGEVNPDFPIAIVDFKEEK